MAGFLRYGHIYAFASLSLTGLSNINVVDKAIMISSSSSDTTKSSAPNPSTLPQPSYTISGMGLSELSVPDKRTGSLTSHLSSDSEGCNGKLYKRIAHNK